MLLLILGLILFLGMHSARLFAAEKRASFIAARGPLAWKSCASVINHPVRSTWRWGAAA